jgi:tetratricopeptide (TPR) repeat protein
MKSIALFAVALVFLVVSPSRAQQVSSTSSQPAAAPAATSTPLTPRQTAELHADILMARREFTEAVKAYEKILEGEPKNAALLNKTGVAYQQLSELSHAERYYKRAIKADSSFASPVNNFGTVEYEKKHYGKAISSYKKALALRADLPTIYSNLGYAYFGNKEFPEAMDSFQKALALDPTIFDRRSETGTIIQQRSTTDPGLFYFFVAKTYALAGDAERAAHYLKLARDDGYKNFLSAENDPAFAKVIKDPRVQEVLQVPPSYARESKRTLSN